MGDGWETRRRREPGNDWIIIKLAQKGKIQQIEIDTAHFKGNFPDQASLQAESINQNVKIEDIIKQSENWDTILQKNKLKADSIHNYKNEIKIINEATHVRLNIFPDGGVSRLRVFGLRV